MNAELLTRTECNVMRGLAILGIFLHNYCHWLSPVVKENEYQYFQHNVDWLLQVCARPDALLPMHLISFSDTMACRSSSSSVPSAWKENTATPSPVHVWSRRSIQVASSAITS